MSDICYQENNVRHLNYSPQLSPRLQVHLEITQFWHLVLFENIFKVALKQRDGLTLKHREMHGCVVSTVATDVLVLKHQAISIHNAD